MAPCGDCTMQCRGCHKTVRKTNGTEHPDGWYCYRCRAKT